MVSLLAAAALALGLMGVAPPARAATTWYVASSGTGDCTSDTPCATLAEALELAGAGDTIRIAPSAEPYAGEFEVTEPLTIEGAEGVAIAPASLDDVTVLLTAATTLKNLTIHTNGGYGIGVDGVAATLENIEIIGQGSEAEYSAGVRSIQDGQIDATGLIIRDTGAAIIADGGAVRLRDSELIDNVSALHVEGAAVDLSGLTVTGGDLGVLVAAPGASLVLADSHFEGIGVIDSGLGDAVMVGVGTTAAVTRTTMVDNRMGVLASGGDLTLTDSRIDGAIDPSQPVDLTQTIGLGIIGSDTDTTVTVSRTEVTRTDIGIMMVGGSRAEITHSTVVDNRVVGVYNQGNEPVEVAREKLTLGRGDAVGQGGPVVRPASASDLDSGVMTVTNSTVVSNGGTPFEGASSAASESAVAVP